MTKGAYGLMCFALGLVVGGGSTAWFLFRMWKP